MSVSSVFCYSKWTPSTMWLEGQNFQPQTQTSGREKGLDIEFSHVANDLIRCAYVIKSHIKTLNHWGSRTFWVGEHIDELVGWPIRRGHGTSAPPSPKTLVYVPLPFGCSWVIIFSNEILIVSIALSWGLWIVSANYWIWGVVMEMLEFVVGQAEVGVAGDPTCCWHLKWETVLWDWSLNLWVLCQLVRI